MCVTSFTRVAVACSIGVISELPNVYERLNREGIEFLTVTAGKYKRTLTPTKKPTDEDFVKTKADIEQVIFYFLSFFLSLPSTFLFVGLPT